MGMPDESRRPDWWGRVSTRSIGTTSSAETIAAVSGDNSIRIDVWFEGQLIAYFAVTVSDPTGSPIGRLDCAHGTVHTHFWGHTVRA